VTCCACRLAKTDKDANKNVNARKPVRCCACACTCHVTSTLSLHHLHTLCVIARRDFCARTQVNIARRDSQGGKRASADVSAQVVAVRQVAVEVEVRAV
jgi:hypothetical protein